MSPSVIINIILWLPFVMVVFIAGLVFCISGYKKGLWRALISTGITLVSAIISFLLSKLIAGMISGGFVEMVNGMLPQDEPMIAAVMPLVRNAVQAFVAIILFSIVFFVLTFILKIIGNVVKRDSLIVEDKKLKWAGLGVRVLDTVVYTVLLLIPLYGTLGAYMPTVQTVLEMTGNVDEEMLSYLGAISNNPLITASNKGPINLVYNELSKVETDGTAVSLPEVVGNLQVTMEKFNALSSVEGEDYEEACLDLVVHLKENVIEEDWSYDIIQQTTGVLKEQVISGMEGADEASKQMVETAIEFLDMPKEEFQENGVVILDYVEYALSNNIMESLQSNQVEALKNEEFYTETATFLNATEQTVTLKEYFINQAVTQAVGGDTDAAKQIMDSYDASAVSTAEAQQKEIETLMSVAGATTKDEIKEALKNSPSFDAAVVEDVFNNLNIE